MKITKTFTATIWVGLRAGYTSSYYNVADVWRIVDKFNNEIINAVTVTPLTFRYVDGSEPGVAVGFIQYPRFTYPEEKIKQRAMELARRLKVGLNQERVSIVFPNETIMLENEDNDTNFLLNGTKI